MQLVVLLVCFLLSICATVTSLMAWKGVHEIAVVPAVPAVSPAIPPARPNTQQLDALTSQVATLSAQVTTLKDTVANLASANTSGAGAQPAPAAPAAAIDDGKIKEMIRAEMLNQFRMMRGGGGGGFNQSDPATVARQLQEQLALDPAKATQVAALMVAERTAVRSIYQNANGASREDLAPKVKDERDKLEVESAKLLSADEQTKFTAWLDHQQMRRQRSDPNGNGNGHAPASGAATTPAPGPSSF